MAFFYVFFGFVLGVIVTSYGTVKLIRNHAESGEPIIKGHFITCKDKV